MSFISYIATERVIGTHTINDAYAKDFDCKILNPYSNVDRVVVKSIDKHEEVSVNSDEDFWGIAATNIDVDDLPEWEEIFFSIRDGSNFTFDPYGTIANQISPNVYTLVNNSFKPQRTAIDTFDIPFTFKKEI